MGSVLRSEDSTPLILKFIDCETSKVHQSQGDSVSNIYSSAID